MLHISPEVGLVDGKLDISGDGFKPNSRVSVIASTQDSTGRTWRSRAVYHADTMGKIDLARDAPIAGTYSQLDPMGLLWSMRPRHQRNTPKSLFNPPDEEVLPVKFTLKNRGKIVAEKTIERKFISPGVTHRTVNEVNVKGEYFIPEGPRPFPAVLMCADSASGMQVQIPMASLLASHGFAVFLMAYYNYKGLPKQLYELPVEKFWGGLLWLRDQPEVDRDRIGAMAAGKGAEGLLSAVCNIADMDLQALILVSPSSVAWQGLGRGKPEQKSSWSLQGKPLPFLRYRGEKLMPQLLLAKYLRKFGLHKLFPRLMRTRFLSAYEVVKSNSTEVQTASLPVEKVSAPMLLVAGDDDHFWPSVYMAQMIREQHQQNSAGKDDEVFIYPGAGHLFNCPNLPSTVSWWSTTKGSMVFDYGGEATAQAQAQSDAWDKMLRFLTQHLQGESI